MTAHTGPILAQRDALTVIQCIACGWAHLDPLPDAAALDAYYTSDFWQTTKAGWREQYEAQRDWLTMRHHDWLTLLQDYTLGTAGRVLLDVGCGWGHFLETARARLWRAYGIEPSAEAHAYALAHMPAELGGGLQRGGWEDCAFAGQDRFDAITAFWLLEHLPDPVAFLRWARGKLAEGGALMLAVPQEWTATQRAANEQAAVKNYWLDPTHLHYWNQATLTGLLRETGFNVVDTLATFPVEWWLLAGHDYTADAAVGAEWHARLRAGELSLPLYERMMLARAWARNEIGRDLIVVAQAA